MPENPDHPQVMVMPPVVYLGYLIGALVLNWIVPFPAPWPLPLRILGGLLVAAGLIFGGSAFAQMTKAHTSPDPHQPTTALVTQGPYRFTRNPIYLGFFLIYLGFTLLAGTLWGLVISPFLLWTITHAAIHAEEDYLEKKFGEQYTAYRSRVRCWI
jgi:protein-S-isoprenylcysteine O-methyltransferase Ste14